MWVRFNSIKLIYLSLNDMKLGQIYSYNLNHYTRFFHCWNFVTGQLSFTSSSSLRLLFLHDKISVNPKNRGAVTPTFIAAEQNGVTFSDRSDPFSSSWLSVLETLPEKDKQTSSDWDQLQKVPTPMVEK